MKALYENLEALHDRNKQTANRLDRPLIHRYENEVIQVAEVDQALTRVINTFNKKLTRDDGSRFDQTEID